MDESSAPDRVRFPQSHRTFEAVVANGILCGFTIEIAVMADVKRLIYPYLPPFIRRAWRGLKVARSNRDLRRVVEGYRLKYGAAFSPTVADADEMLQFLEQMLSLPRPSAVAEYLRSGESMLLDLERIMDRAGRTLDGNGSFLEFACGYGRFTRFLVRRIDPARVSVSDIEPKAVAFVRQTFGVNGFDSVADPATLPEVGMYDVIFVASLFSHLSIGFWTEWATKLMSMLKPGGVLVFSVHGPHALDQLRESDRQALQAVVPGFWYGTANETSGRLDGDYYGSAFVNDEFVRDFFTSRELGRLIQCVPRGLWSYQDVYVVERQVAPPN